MTREYEDLLVVGSVHKAEDEIVGQYVPASRRQPPLCREKKSEGWGGCGQQSIGKTHARHLINGCSTGKFNFLPYMATL